METDEKQRGKEAAVLSGGHLCHVCGYQYPNPHPSAKLRRSHRKHCGKAAPTAAAAAVVEEEGVAVEGLRVGEREERNADDGALLGGKGGGAEGKTEANGGAALLGSAREVAESVEVEDKAIAEHSSSNGIRVHQVTCESNENDQINCMNSEKVSPDGKAVNSEFSRNGLVNCSSNSEHVSEGNGVELPIACTSGRQDEVAKHCSELASVAVANPAEREDSFDEYQDASPFLHQSDSEDGAAPSLEFPVEINNLKSIVSESSVAANEIPLGTNGLCKDQASGEISLNDLSAGSKVGNDSENETLSVAGPEASLKRRLPYESCVSVGSNHTNMIDDNSDKRFYNFESIGDPDASSLQEAHSVVLDADSQSTCSTKMHGVMENAVHAFNNLYEASARPEAAESSNVQLETMTGSCTNTMPHGDDLKVVHTENNPKQNCSVKDASDVQWPVESLCQKKLFSTTALENNLPPATDVDETLYSITKDSCSDMDFTFEARTQPHIVEQVNVAEENTNGSTEEEVCNKQTDPEISTDQFPKNHSHDVLPIDQTSCIKNPFDLDDPRNDDLFELPTDSCYLEVPSADVYRQQLDSASVIVDQPTISNRTTMVDAQHNHSSNECILFASSSGENSLPVGPKDTPSCSSAELVTETHLADAPLDHRRQEDDAHTSVAPFVLSQVAPMEFSTVGTQDTSACCTGVENTQTPDASAKMMTAVPTTDNSDTKQADGTAATDIYAIKIEAKKVTKDAAAKMNEVQHCNFEEKQSDSTKVSAVQSICNLEENKPTEGTNMEMYAQVNGNDLEGKWQTDDTSAKTNAIGCTVNFEEKICVQATSTKEMIAAQSTEKVEENKQANTTVRQEGNNQKEEIAVTGGRLNSGRIHVPLKVLLAEASAENKVQKPSAKERVLSFRCRVSKNDNSSPKPGSSKSASDGHQWESPARLPRKDTDKSSKGRKQPWMPFICCHSVR